MSFFQKYRKITLFALVFVLLVAPLSLRTINSRLEPYPAILFPAGAKTVNTNKGIVRFSNTEFLGIDKNENHEREISPNLLIQPIPLHYKKYLVNKKLGLLQERKLTLRFKYAPLQPLTINRPSPDQSELIKTKEWLRSNLEKVGFLPSTLTIKRTIVEFNTKTGETKTIDTFSSESIDLR